MRRDRAKAGKRPCSTFRIISGSNLIQLKKKMVLLSDSTLDIPPTMTEGMDQKMMAAAMTTIIKNRRIMCSHHLMRKEPQMISSGRMPMKHGDMCSGWWWAKIWKAAWALA